MTCRRYHRPSTEREVGAVLPLALVVIVIIGLIVLGAMAALNGPTTMLGKFAKSEAGLREAESRLEQARAMLIADPSSDLSPAKVAVTWSPIDSCILTVSTTTGDLTVTETWSVIAPTLHTIHVDSGVFLDDSSAIEGPIFDARDHPTADTDLVDTTIFANLITRRIQTQLLEATTIRNEIVELTAIESGPIILRDIEIDRGLLIVNGDVIIEGKFNADARGDLPLLVITGELLSSMHPDLWHWKGMIAVRRNALIAGPADFEGTVLSASIEFVGKVQARLHSATSPPAWPPSITLLGRSENH